MHWNKPEPAQEHKMQEMLQEAHLKMLLHVTIVLITAAETPVIQLQHLQEVIRNQ